MMWRWEWDPPPKFEFPEDISTCMTYSPFLIDALEERRKKMTRDDWCNKHNIVIADRASRYNTDHTEINFNDLQNNLANIGVELVELRQEYGEPMEITGRLVGPLRIAPTKPPRKPHPKKVIFSGPATTILWKDGTKTTVKCQRHDIWDKDVGIGMCYLKKLLGNKGNFNNIFREAMKVAKEEK